MLAYFDCFAGVSGDMTLGALVDMGVPGAWLEAQLNSLFGSGFSLRTTQTLRRGIRATRLEVIAADNAFRRNFTEICALIDQSPFSPGVRASSLKIFHRIADAEAMLHGCPREEVHFHEIGAVDSLVDVVGTCLALEFLGVREICASKIPLGTGWVDCAHGRLPVPAPATLEILKGATVFQTEIPHELTTPTGAAILAALSRSFQGFPEMIVEKIGYGAGARDLEAIPNILRILLGRRLSPKPGTGDRVVVAECAIDDMNPEYFGHVMERLFKDGALDVYWIPIFMKKNRPGTLVQVLCPESRREAILSRLLTETTSIGVRYSEALRWTLPRESVEVKTEFGRLAAKRVRGLDGKWRIVPEYEVCRAAALKRDIPLRVVYEAVLAAGALLKEKPPFSP